MPLPSAVAHAARLVKLSQALDGVSPRINTAAAS
jgi:hypothetical protein